jgi:hypothetical protein
MESRKGANENSSATFFIYQGIFIWKLRPKHTAAGWKGEIQCLM